MIGWDREGGRRNRRNRTPIESIVAGGVFTGVFGSLLIFRGGGEWWWLFPMMFAGVLPMAEGIRRLISGKRLSRDALTEREAEAEKQILRAAQEQKGKLTAATAALNTSLTLKEAQSLLEKMTKEGHAVMNVTREGTLEFEFPEFLPRITKELS